MIILLFLTFTFRLTTIIAIGICDKSDITHSLQDDSILINFLSNDLLKFNRNIRCNSSSPFSPINGCAHHCTGLGYGQRNKLSIEILYDNGTIEECFIDYTIPLQPPTLGYFNITDNKVRLGIDRPIGSFDYVQVDCSDNKSYIIFNTSIPSNTSQATVDCSFLPNMPLMSFILKTIKKDFDPAVAGISREVPLPISFTYSLNERLLTIIADSPSTINIDSTYELQLLFHDEKNDNIIYQRDKVSNLNPKLGATFNYGLLPNLKHTIIFKHIVQSLGYSQSNMTISPVSIPSYPFAVTNLHIKEEFNSILLNWTDNHDLYDPIEYIVFCNSTNENSKKNVGRNTTYICEQMTFSETNMISVQTQVSIPGYTYDRTAIAQVNVSQIPEVPIFEIFNTTENSITIRWNLTDQSLITDSFRYKINCSSDVNSTDIDIQSNEYQCQSLVPGTLYIITIFLENTDTTIQRSRSINANTLLEKCQYRNHFYSPDLNGTRSVIIEWSPPEKNFDEIQVHCPSSYMTFQSSQTMPIMLVKCAVTNGIQFNVTFATVKSGYEWGILQFTDALTIDTTTATTETTTETSTITTTTTTTATETSTITTTTTTNTPTTTTTKTPTTTTTTKTSTTTTAETSTTTLTTSSRGPIPTVTSICPQNDLLETQGALTRWRTIAIVALIIAGFLVLTTICLSIFFVLLFLRSRHENTG